MEEENERLRELAVTLKDKVDALSDTATSSAGKRPRQRPYRWPRSGLAGGRRRRGGGIGTIRACRPTP